jgi:hypothetical protein
LQLDAARDIREQLKQCYRTHGMNHQDKCKVRFVTFIHLAQSVPICHVYVYKYLCSRVLPLPSVTHHSGTRARVSESKQRVSEHGLVVSHSVAATLAAAVSPLILNATSKFSVGTTKKFAKLAPFK